MVNATLSFRNPISLPKNKLQSGVEWSRYYSPSSWDDMYVQPTRASELRQIHADNDKVVVAANTQKWTAEGYDSSFVVYNAPRYAKILIWQDVIATENFVRVLAVCSCLLDQREHRDDWT